MSKCFFIFGMAFLAAKRRFNHQKIDEINSDDNNTF